MLVLVLAAFVVALVGLCFVLTRKPASVQIVEERTTLLTGQRRMPAQGDRYDDDQTADKFDRLWEAALATHWHSLINYRRRRSTAPRF